MNARYENDYFNNIFAFNSSFQSIFFQEVMFSNIKPTTGYFPAVIYSQSLSCFNILHSTFHNCNVDSIVKINENDLNGSSMVSNCFINCYSNAPALEFSAIESLNYSSFSNINTIFPSTESNFDSLVLSEKAFLSHELNCSSSFFYTSVFYNYLFRDPDHFLVCNFNRISNCSSSYSIYSSSIFTSFLQSQIQYSLFNQLTYMCFYADI